MNDRFKGKVVLVAGGTGGLGRAISLAFLQEGARVIATYHIPSEFEALQAVAGNASLEGERLDVTDVAAVTQAIQRIVGTYSRVDAMVNAVGGYAGGSKLWDTESGTLDRMLSLNLRAGFVLAHAVAPVMMSLRSGAIVNIAARAGVEPTAGNSAYSASKAAAIAMLESLAAELKGSGVRANSVLPSIIDTEANRKAMPDADFTKWPKAADIAKVVLFLCGDDARVIHGAAIPVYGTA